MNTQQALKILGLTTPHPTREEVKRAYREQAKLWHPDRYSSGSVMKRLAVKNIQDANLAYAFLKKNLPESPVKSPPQQTRGPSGHHWRRHPSSASKMVDLARQLVAKLNHHFPSVNLRSIISWLAQDANNRFRPWYRYPSRTGSGPEGNRNHKFEDALQKAMRNPSGIRRLRRGNYPSARKEREDIVGKVNGVPSSKRVK